MMGGEHKYQISPEEYVFAGEYFFKGNFEFLDQIENF
jgi:hypothetical protein